MGCRFGLLGSVTQIRESQLNWRRRLFTAPLRIVGFIHDAEPEAHLVDAFELKLVHHDVALSAVGVYSRVVL